MVALGTSFIFPWVSNDVPFTTYLRVLFAKWPYRNIPIFCIIFCAYYLGTIRSNQNSWKAILWSKIRVLWHSINHLKSAAIHSFKILCCRKFVDLLHEVLCILVSQGADKLPGVKVWDLIKNLLRAHSNIDLLSKSVFECAHTRFFIKPQTLTSSSWSAPWDTRVYSTSFERSTNLLQHKMICSTFKMIYAISK